MKMRILAKVAIWMIAIECGQFLHLLTDTSDINSVLINWALLALVIVSGGVSLFFIFKLSWAPKKKNKKR